MKAQPLTHEQVLSRISKFYQDDFQQLTKSVIQLNENIIWAGNTTHLVNDYRSFGFGYLLVTSYRIIHVSYIVERGVLGLGIGRETIRVEDKDYKNALDIPHRTLTAEELRSRSVSEVALQSISQVHRRDVKARTGQEKILVELNVSVSNGSLGYPMLFYSFQDGQGVYDLLQNSIRNRDLLDNAIPDIADQLAKLAKLYQDKAITKEEYEAAKRKLLG